MQIRPRLPFLTIFVLVAGLLGFGYYLQFVLHEEPCPMCIFQRIAYMAVGAVALAGAMHGPGALGTRLYSGLMALAALIGGGIAARQVWLQHLPAEQVPECGPGLEFMLEVLPLFDVIKRSLAGTGECAEVGWRFLGLSIAEWSLFWFVALTAAAVTLIVKPRLFSR